MYVEEKKMFLHIFSILTIIRNIWKVRQHEGARLFKITKSMEPSLGNHVIRGIYSELLLDQRRKTEIHWAIRLYSTMEEQPRFSQKDLLII